MLCEFTCRVIRLVQHSSSPRVYSGTESTVELWNSLWKFPESKSCGLGNQESPSQGRVVLASRKQLDDSGPKAQQPVTVLTKIPTLSKPSPYNLPRETN